MKHFLINLFSESSNVSMVRVLSFVTVLSACYLALTKGPDEVGVITVMLSTGFAGKVAQKFAENKTQ